MNAKYSEILKFVKTGILYLLTFFIILNCHSVYNNAIETDYHITLIIMILVVFLVFIEISDKLKKSSLKMWANFIAFYFLFCIVFIIFSVSVDSFSSFLLRFMVFFPLMLLINISETKKGNEYLFLKAYVNIMLIICVVSLFFWVFGSNLKIISPNMHIYVHWGEDFYYPGYFGLYFERQSSSFLFYEGIRNSAFFAEGPMYSLCLVLALSFQMFLFENEKHGLVKNIILIVGIISTVTTTGFCLLLMIISLKFIQFKGKNSVFKVFKWLLTVILLVVVANVGISIFVEKSTSFSWGVRFNTLRVAYLSLLRNPLFGGGYGNEDVLYSFHNYISGYVSYSSGLSIVICQGGILLLMFYIFPFFLGLKNIISKNVLTGLFCVILIYFMEFIFTYWPYTFLILSILSVLYSLKICHKIA